MTPGILLVSVWFILVAAYLVWQFATGTLAAPNTMEETPLPAPVPAEPFILQPAPAPTRSTLLPVSVSVR